MPAYTKEQIELVNKIRELVKEKPALDYKKQVYLAELQEQANKKNLCWW